MSRWRLVDGGAPVPLLGPTHSSPAPSGAPEGCEPVLTPISTRSGDLHLHFTKRETEAEVVCPRPRSPREKVMSAGEPPEGKWADSGLLPCSLYELDDPGP